MSTQPSNGRGEANPTSIAAMLGELLKKATPQNIDTSEVVESGCYECPLCSGEGEVDGVTYTNFDNAAIGVQFFGVGDGHKHAEALFRGVTKHLPALLQSLIAKEKEIEGLREALRRIEKWFGEFPATGRFWDKEGTDPMSYGAAFGSNGERDYMRAIARAALDQGKDG